jgi:putative membrane protein
MTNAPTPTSNELAEQRTTLADDRTSLALDRTRLAHERTLMAWVRTAVSLISFGFTIYKFFQYLRESEDYVARSGVLSPRSFGLLLIGIGLSALVLATIDHVRHMRAMRAEYGDVPYSLAAGGKRPGWRRRR